MTAITTLVTGNQATKLIRTASAQATTGQTDWIVVPTWARYALWYFDLTAVGGTTPIFTPKFLIANPINPADTGIGTLKLAEHGAFTGLTQAGALAVQMGPGITGIADDTTNSATVVSYASLNVVLPPLLGVNITNDRTTGDETYTYTIQVAWRN
jgi:hypothetical protein